MCAVAVSNGLSARVLPYSNTPVVGPRWKPAATQQRPSRIHPIPLYKAKNLASSPSTLRFQGNNIRGQRWVGVRAEAEGGSSLKTDVVQELRQPVETDGATNGSSSNGSSASGIDSSSDVEDVRSMAQTLKRVQTKRRTKVESTDAVATFLTRRFGLAGGMAWLGILAAGTIGEQVKTRLEVAAEESGKKDVLQAKEVQLPSGVRYTDLRIGAGATPQRGDLVILDFMLSVDGKVIEDTTKRGKPVVFVFGRRPLSGGLCAGVEEALSDMRAGGRRRVVVPPAAGFPDGTILRQRDQDPSKAGVIPAGATLYYDLDLLRVSIAP